MLSFPEGVFSAKKYYADLGFDTLPLSAGSKICHVEKWQIISPNEAWLHAPSDSNIGIRCGGKRHFAVIDCDEKNKVGTFENIKNYLTGLGYDDKKFPVIQTASGIGRQIYCTLTDSIPGDYHNLSPQYGCGEFRFGEGAYVVAPPSIVKNTGVYKLLQGDISYLPEIELSAISYILKVSTSGDRYEDSKRILKYPKLTRKQNYMLNGIGVDKYPSRSEFEFALLVSLVNTGWDWNGIFYLFNNNKCGGKYSELNSKNWKQAYHYLRLSYENACQWAENTSEGRQRAINAEAWALSRSWSGRTGCYDRDVFLAQVNIAYETGKVIYHADCRTLAEFANVNYSTASRANRRLIQAGYLQLEQAAIANCAAKYSLGDIATLPQSPNVRECCITSKDHDVFARRGLGKSSKFIWNALEDGPKTVEELLLLTGRVKKTVQKWLTVMSGLEDGVSEKPMVYESEGKWYRNQDISLERISEFLEVNGLMDKRKKRHQEERVIHNSAFMRNRRM